MAEQKPTNQENIIKKVNDLITGKKLLELLDSVKGVQSEVKSIKGVLLSKIKEIKEKETAEKVTEEKPVEEVKEPVIPKVTEEVEKVENKEKKVEPVVEEKPAVQKEEKKEEEKKDEKKLPSFIVRRASDEKPQRPTYTPNNNREPRGERPQRPQGDRPSRPQGAPFNKKPTETYVAPPIVIESQNKRGGKKKPTQERSYDENRHALNKRSLVKNQVSIEDFDENKTGYRKFRPVKKAKQTQETQTIKIEKAVITSEIIPLKVLSEKIGITAAEITKRLFKEGIMKTINDSIDFDTAAL